MRFFTSIFLLCASLVCLVVGFGQQTWLKPPATQSTIVAVERAAPLTVVDGSVLTRLPGRVTATTTGDGALVVAVASTEDVDAWVADARVNRAVATEDSDDPTVTTTGSETEVPDPAGSDLWVQEATGESTLAISIEATADQSILIASDGTEAAPETVKLTWRVDNSMPWALPLIITGSVLLLIGALLLVLAIRSDRLRNGPRRKSRRMSDKKGAATGLKITKQRHGRRAVGRIAAVTGAVTVLTFSLLTPAYAESGDATPSATGDAGTAETPPITEQHFSRILTDVATVLNSADDTLDSDALSTRAAGAAYEVRSVNYTIRSSDSGYSRPDPIPSATPALFLPPVSHAWPRQILTVVDDPSDDANALAMLLEQTSPRENYKVMYVSKLLTDAEFPSVAAADVGGVSLPQDTTLLSISPASLADAYADVIANDDQSESAALFATADDPFIAAAKARQEQALADIGEGGSVEFQRGAFDQAAISLSTADSGAVVGVYMKDIEISRPAENNELKINSSALQALLGKASTTSSMTATYGDMLLFYVPPAGDKINTIRLLGVTSGLVTATES